MSSVLHWTELNMKMDEVIKEMMAKHEKRWLEKQSMTRDNVFYHAQNSAVFQLTTIQRSI